MPQQTQNLLNELRRLESPPSQTTAIVPLAAPATPTRSGGVLVDLSQTQDGYLDLSPGSIKRMYMPQQVIEAAPGLEPVADACEVVSSQEPAISGPSSSSTETSIDFSGASFDRGPNGFWLAKLRSGAVVETEWPNIGPAAPLETDFLTKKRPAAHTIDQGALAQDGKAGHKKLRGSSRVAKLQALAPEGWKVYSKTRISGSSAGATDCYFVSPTGETFRSLVQAQKAWAK